MGILGNLFGTDKAVDDLLDKDEGLLVKAGGFFGNLVLTDQEKMNYGLTRLKALEPFKIMQRIMVSIIMIQWAIMFNVIVVAICLDATTVVNNLLQFSQTQFAWMPVAGAVSLYLLGGVLPSKVK